MEMFATTDERYASSDTPSGSVFLKQMGVKYLFVRHLNHPVSIPQQDHGKIHLRIAVVQTLAHVRGPPDHQLAISAIGALARITTAPRAVGATG
jgi:hypothetical protein